jgi:hypothetical protein
VGCRNVALARYEGLLSQVGGLVILAFRQYEGIYRERFRRLATERSPLLSVEGRLALG